jgi:hypothetical protein
MDIVRWRIYYSLKSRPEIAVQLIEKYIGEKEREVKNKDLAFHIRKESNQGRRYVVLNMADKVVDKAISKQRAEGIKDVIAKGMAEEASMYALSREIVQASDWEGEKESELCVIKCLTASLSLDVGVSKKRKI